MVDLGVIEVELGCSSMLGQSAQERIDEDIEALAQVVAGLDDIAAVTVDESREIGGKDLPADQDIGAFFEVPDPEVMGIVPGPAFSHLLFDDTELEACGARTFKMAIQGGAGEHHAVAVSQEPVDRGVGALGLLLFELDGGCNDFLGCDSRPAPVSAVLSGKGIESSHAIALELSPKGGKGGFAGPSAGKDRLFARELFEKILNLFRLHLVEEDGVEEIAPEKCPFFVFLLHMLPPWLMVGGEHRSSPGAPSCKEGEN